MHAYICVYICIYMYIYAHICIHIYMYTHTRIIYYTYIYVYVQLRAHRFGPLVNLLVTSCHIYACVHSHICVGRVTCMGEHIYERAHLLGLDSNVVTICIYKYIYICI